MKPLDPYDASILNVLATVPDEMAHLRQELFERLDTEEGKEVGRAILTPDATLSKDAQVTAASLRRPVVVS